MNNNDEKITIYRRKRIIDWIIVGLSLIVIILLVLSLMNKISMLWGCGGFIIVFLLKKILK